ncbi:hypothetical protein ABIB95_008692 [Bradyrhizobium sp. LA2.1]
MPAKHARPWGKGYKKDFDDADARRSHAPPEDEVRRNREQLDLQAPHQAREWLMSQHTDHQPDSRISNWSAGSLAIPDLKNGLVGIAVAGSDFDVMEPFGGDLAIV